MRIQRPINFVQSSFYLHKFLGRVILTFPYFLISSVFIHKNQSKNWPKITRKNRQLQTYIFSKKKTTITDITWQFSKTLLGDCFSLFLFTQVLLMQIVHTHECRWGESRQCVCLCTRGAMDVYFCMFVCIFPILIVL